LESALARADAALRDKKFDDAIAAYQEAQKLLEAKLTDARAAKQLDAWIEALPEFNDLIARANHALAANRFAEALDAFSAARAKLPEDVNKRQLDAESRARAEKERVDRADTDRAAAARAAADRMAAERVAAAAAANKAAVDRAVADRAAADKAAADRAAVRQMALDQFSALVTRGNQALAAKNYADAVAAFDAARAKLPDEFQKQRLQAKIDEATRALHALQALQAAATPRAAARWYPPYLKAMDALKKQRWADAVPLFEEAIALDDVPGANKRVEGTITEDYFPQFYLFYAHVKLKEYDKAKPYASAPRPAKPIMSDAADVIAEYDKNASKH
jgi:hypothetical protein